MVFKTVIALLFCATVIAAAPTMLDTSHYSEIDQEDFTIAHKAAELIGFSIKTFNTAKNIFSRYV